MNSAQAFSNPRGVERAIRAALAMFEPPPNVAPSEWAEKNIRLPQDNAVPGPYRIANAPYQREPMDMLIHPGCYRITLKWGAQTGKTLTALCVQGYCIEFPRSQMMMQPSQGDAQTWLETKFNPLVESSPSVKRRVAKARGREGVNNQKMKSYPGGYLMMAWAGSPKTMRGRSAPLITCDEVDGYQRTKEGHPAGILWQRSATYGDRRFQIIISTPTIKGASYVDDSFEDGDQRHFHVACPHCAAHQVMRWENVSWIGRKSVNVEDAEEDLTHDEHEPRTAVYVCEVNGCTWTDGERVAAIRSAEAVGAGWKAKKPFRGHASYHIWEAYSTLRKLSDIVQDYLDKLKTDDLQTFVNVSLAESFEEKGSKADPHALEQRAEDFPAQVPMGGVYLTAGIDMQTDRLEVEVVAWGEGEESWSVDYRVLWGDPLAGEVWEDLDALLAESYLHESGAKLPISAACLDTGGTNGYTQCAYEYLRGKSGRRLFGIKGLPGWGRPIVEKMLRKQSGKNARKVDLFGVGVDEAKLVVMRRLAVEKPGPGYCHVPKRDGLTEWCKGITSEKLLLRYVKGHPVREWHKPDKARNEPLDCRAYALAALKIMQPPIRRLKEKLMAHPRVRAQLEQQAPPPPPRAPQKQRPEIPPEVTKKPSAQTNRVHRSPAARRVKSSWVHGWK